MKLRNRGLSSFVGLALMAVLISLFTSLFAIFASSYVNYASALKQELEYAANLAAESRLCVKARSNGTHVIFKISNNAMRSVVIQYLYYRDGDRIFTKRLNLAVPPASSKTFVMGAQQLGEIPSEVVLITRGGVKFKLNLTFMPTNETMVKVPSNDVNLIVDIDVVDFEKPTVAAAYREGGVMLIDLENSSIVWSKEYLHSECQTVSYVEKLDAILSMILTKTFDPLNSYVDLIALRRDGKLLWLKNFFNNYASEVIYQSIEYIREEVQHTIYYPFLAWRKSNIVLLPSVCLDGGYVENYARHFNSWTYTLSSRVVIGEIPAPTLNELTVQEVCIHDLYVGFDPAQYEKNPDLIFKPRVVAAVLANSSDSTYIFLLVNGHLYAGAEDVTSYYRCDPEDLDQGILLPPTLHAIINGSLGWYKSLYPCDVDSPCYLCLVNDTLVVSTGSYLYCLNFSGNVVKTMNFEECTVDFMKYEESYKKLILHLSNGSLVIFNTSLSVEKTLQANGEVVDVALMDPSTIVVFNETHVYSVDPLYKCIAKLPASPTKVVKLDSSHLLMACDEGIFCINVEVC